MLYAIKEVPILYYYVDNSCIGKDFCLTNFNYIYNGKHNIIVKSSLLDCRLLQLLQDLVNFTIYTWTKGRTREDGEDEILCYKYTDVNLERFEYDTKCDGELARFEYVFSATTRELISIDDLPQEIQDEIK